MRMMARVNVTIPDYLLRQAKDAELNISKLTRDAIVQELDRRAKIALIDTYLAELDAELGPISPQEQAAAEALVDRAYGTPEGDRRSA
jgi:post-segregation antitoxin CcdA